MALDEEVLLRMFGKDLFKDPADTVEILHLLLAHEVLIEAEGDGIDLDRRHRLAQLRLGGDLLKAVAAVEFPRRSADELVDDHLIVGFGRPHRGRRRADRPRQVDVDLDLQLLRRDAVLELADALVLESESASAKLLAITIENEAVLRLLLRRQIGLAKLAAIKSEAAFELAIVQGLRFAGVLPPIDGGLVLSAGPAAAEILRHALTQFTAVGGELLAQRLGLLGRKLAACKLIARRPHALAQSLIVECCGILVASRHSR